MNQWKKYGIQDGQAQAFRTVSHTSHIDSAISIVKNNEIRPSLVFDESILNKKRIQVSWLSPNTWHNGYRYGNVMFDFDFQALVADKNCYWVEAIPYTPQALRILITDKERELEPYDSTASDGPWRYDKTNKTHFYNRKYCLEFMFESAIDLSHLTKISFVKHHPDFCSIHRKSPRTCADLGMQREIAGARFISRTIAADLSIANLPGLIALEGRPDASVSFAFSEIQSLINKADFIGTCKSNDDLAPALAYAICSAFSYGRRGIALKLMGQFKSDSSCRKALANVFAEAIGLQDPTTL